MKISGFLCGLFVLAIFSAPPAQADDIVVTLDVAFSSAAPGAPGTWELFGRVVDTGSGPDGSFGISALRALLDDIDYGTDGDAITIMPGIGAIDPVPTSGGDRIPALLLAGGTVDLLYGQDISDGPSVVPNVGVGGDALIAYGTFSAGDSPAFGSDGNFLTDALFLNTDTPPFGGAIDPGSVFTMVNQRTVPEPASLALLLVAGLAVTTCRRSRS